VKFRLGITGGIGSGKSTICRVFSVLGIPVFMSDEEAREIMEKEERIIEGVKSIAGYDIYKNGSLDRPALAGLIFNNDEILNRINQLVHPAVLEAFDRWVEKQDSEYVILESAILLESNIDWSIDKILAVIAPIEERVSRVMERNSITREQVMERIRNQISETELIRKSDFIINNADSEMILSDVIRIHNDIINGIRN
jgi:dephospho-CoA kinase